MHKILFQVIVFFNITYPVITPSAFSKYLGEKMGIEWHTTSTNCRVQKSLWLILERCFI